MMRISRPHISIFVVLLTILCLSGVASGFEKVIFTGNQQVGNDYGHCTAPDTPSPWVYEFTLTGEEVDLLNAGDPYIEFDIADMKTGVAGPRILINGAELGRITEPNAIETCTDSEARRLPLLIPVVADLNTVTIECADAGGVPDDIVIYQIKLDNFGPTAVLPTYWGLIKAIYR